MKHLTRTIAAGAALGAIGAPQQASAETVIHNQPTINSLAQEVMKLSVDPEFRAKGGPTRTTLVKELKNGRTAVVQLGTSGDLPQLGMTEGIGEVTELSVSINEASSDTTSGQIPAEDISFTLDKSGRWNAVHTKKEGKYTHYKEVDHKRIVRESYVPNSEMADHGSTGTETHSSKLGQREFNTMERTADKLMRKVEDDKGSVSKKEWARRTAEELSQELYGPTAQKSVPVGGILNGTVEYKNPVSGDFVESYVKPVMLAEADPLAKHDSKGNYLNGSWVGIPGSGPDGHVVIEPVQLQLGKNSREQMRIKFDDSTNQILRGAGIYPSSATGSPDILFGYDVTGENRFPSFQIEAKGMK